MPLRLTAAKLLAIVLTGTLILFSFQGHTEDGRGEMTPIERTSSRTIQPEAAAVTGASETSVTNPVGPGEKSGQSLLAPDDPCLPPLYHDWRELAEDRRGDAARLGLSRVRVTIDRSKFMLIMEGIRHDESIREIYRTPVGLGDPWSPTPRGRYYINHVYCYPDVVFFDQDESPISDLYNGFFAPLLLCDGSGRCDRFHDLGIHGFHASAHPSPSTIRPQTDGPVSAGCIRVPDPCRFKMELVRLAGIGPIRRNKRGSYHWLSRPIEVLITNEYPWSEGELAVGRIFRDGFMGVRDGLKSVLDALSP